MPTATSESAGPAELGPIVGCTEEERTGVFDLAVIGGGIYGVATLLEASRRGLRALLLEADDFGGGVSWSSHRIIHGGLRYLQSLDIARFRESVRERRWFLETFPEQIEPLGCLVPLTGVGTRRASLFACASLLNNTLNSLFGGGSDRIASAGVKAAAHLRETAPGINVEHLRGVGSWQDGLMISSERVLITMLRRACDFGGCAMRGVRVAEASARAESGSEIRLRCEQQTGEDVVVRTRRVVNCAGPASGGVADLLGGSHAPLFDPLRAFNILLDVEPRLREAVAFDAASLDDRMLFIVPGPAGLAIGTWEEPADGHVIPTRTSVDRLLEAAGDALGRSDLTFDRVSAVWSGLLPRAAHENLTPSDRPVVVDHGRAGGLAGAYSVSGVKYTTARLVAERVVCRAFPDAPPPSTLEPIRDTMLGSEWLTTPPDRVATEALVRRMIQDEMAATVDDICRRRTAWYTSPDRLRGAAHAIGVCFGMDASASAEAVEDSIRAARAVRG